MENKKAPVFILSIFATIIGSALYKQFDFETLKFEKPALAIVYLICLVPLVYIIIRNIVRNSKNRPGK